MEPQLKKWLKKHDIEYDLYSHPPVYTVAQAEKYCGDIPGAHIKNLFLKAEPTNTHYLVTLPGEERLDIGALENHLKVDNLRFADENALKRYLGLTAGAVSPLGLINDKENRVIFVIEKQLWQSESIVAHPNVNTESLKIARDSFHKIIKECENEYQIISLKFE